MLRPSMAKILARAPGGDAPPEAPADPMAGITAAASDVIAAMEKKDARALASALVDAHRLCAAYCEEGSEEEG